MSENMHDRTEPYPYYAHEIDMNRMERINKRWFIAFLVVLAMLFATNAGWIIYESQFQDVVIEQDASTDGGGNNYLNGTGVINYGESETGDPYPGEAER